MKRAKKLLSVLLCVAMLSGILVTNAAGTDVTIGNTIHYYTYVEPAHFILQGIVSYSNLTSSSVKITEMQSRIWNFADSDTYLSAPTFTVETESLCHSTTYATLYYNSLTIPEGTSNYYTDIAWQTFLNQYYSGASNQYTVPQNTSSTDHALKTLIGVYAGSFYDNGIAYNYSAYWYGDGHIDIYDNVANTPYWTSKTVTLSGSNSAPSEPVAYTINTVADNTEILDIDSDKISLSLSVEADDTLLFASSPIIATDENFEHVLEIDENDIIIGNENTMYITAQCDEAYDTLYIKMPDVTLIDADVELLASDISGIQSKEIIDEENGIKLIELAYDSDTFSITPKSATLIGSQNIECLTSRVYYDDDNNVLGGSLVFAVPDDFALDNSYSLLLQGELVDIAGAVYEVSV